MNKRTFIKGLGAASLVPMVGTVNASAKGLNFIHEHGYNSSWDSNTAYLFDWRNVNYVAKKVENPKFVICVDTRMSGRVKDISINKLINKHVNLFFLQELLQTKQIVSSKDEFLENCKNGSVRLSFKAFFHLFGASSAELRQSLAIQLNSQVVSTSESVKIADKEIFTLPEHIALFAGNIKEELNIYNEVLYQDIKYSVFAIDVDTPKDYKIFDLSKLADFSTGPSKKIIVQNIGADDKKTFSIKDA